MTSAPGTDLRKLPSAEPRDFRPCLLQVEVPRHAAHDLGVYEALVAQGREVRALGGGDLVLVAVERSP